MPPVGSSSRVPSQAPKTESLRNTPPTGKRCPQVFSWTPPPAALRGGGTPGCHAPPSPQSQSKTLTNSWMTGTSFSPRARTPARSLLVETAHGAGSQHSLTTPGLCGQHHKDPRGTGHGAARAEDSRVWGHAHALLFIALDLLRQHKPFSLKTSV